MRKPPIVSIPERDQAAAARQTAYHLRRLYVEATDYRSETFWVGSLGHNQTVTIGGASSITPTRDRHYLDLQLTYRLTFDPGSGGSGAGARTVVTATLYSGGVGSANVVFNLVLGPTAGTGWKSGAQNTVANVGQDWLTPTIGWSIVVSATGGGGNAAEDVTVQVSYEDFVPYQDRSTS